MTPYLKYSLFCMVFLLGCSYGLSTRTNVARISDTDYEPHERPIDVLFEDSKTEKEYVQIAFIEIRGGRGYKDSSSDALLRKMKQEAQKLGADALVNVKVAPMTREAGYLFDEEEEHYSTIFMTGIAIKYKTENR
ncbi:YbjQ family protein [candidate division KSB1 bacterium]|nr:YbjQ family protein [candidate division KSB1 bacterium]NIS25400.1 YbjQ family protein [candidate division KSB1 bacterium]NIT72288.1 YbjQ family protein [candidate division KSB1 bacterium]NIU25695.1 YbjQ family protein [candidate division KSB1 bacterium]NIU93445.1 hypothetical protein [candidate division KSB1 bacterium]